MSKVMVVYGGAANPPHLGHVDAIEQLLERSDMVRFVPAANHAFGKRMLPFKYRLEMSRLLVDEAFGSQDRVIVDDLEAELSRGGSPVYSIQVLRELKRRHPGWKLLLAVGPDNAAPEVWSRFRDYEVIDREFGKVVVAQRKDIRSTAIRERLGKATGMDEVELQLWLESQVGKRVAGYILSQRLYRQGGEEKS